MVRRVIIGSLIERNVYVFRVIVKLNLRVSWVMVLVKLSVFLKRNIMRVIVIFFIF